MSAARRRHGPYLAAILVLAACGPAGCGRKTPVRPPELVVPERITDLRARPAATGIELRWSRPERYADGSRMFDLAGFLVERRDGGRFRRIADLPVTDRDRFRQMRRFRWTDRAVDPGQRHAYRVRSYTTEGYTSEPSNTVEAVWQPPAALPGSGAP